jgi:hypothetical protein
MTSSSPEAEIQRQPARNVRWNRRYARRTHWIPGLRPRMTAIYWVVS